MGVEETNKGIGQVEQKKDNILLSQQRTAKYVNKMKKALYRSFVCQVQNDVLSADMGILRSTSAKTAASICDCLGFVISTTTVLSIEIGNTMEANG
jgi:hypothetical protein